MCHVTSFPFRPHPPPPRALLSTLPQELITHCRAYGLSYSNCNKVLQVGVLCVAIHLPTVLLVSGFALLSRVASLALALAATPCGIVVGGNDAWAENSTW